MLYLSQQKKIDDDSFNKISKRLDVAYAFAYLRLKVWKKSSYSVRDCTFSASK